jgi:uncharacterized protein YkwD
MNRLALLLPALAVLCAGLVGGAAQAAPTARADATYSSTAHAATNKARVKQGLKPLKVSRCLQTYADRQAAAMAAAGEIGHQDLGAVAAGCSLRGVGENVAYGFTSGKAVVKGWMASPGHRANILTKSFRSEAIAAALGADGRWYAAQVFGR